MKKSRPFRLTSVGNVLQSFLGDIGLGNMIRETRISKGWRNIVGDGLSRVSRPAFLKNRVLYVDVFQAIWVESFLFHQADILKSIEALLGPGTVNRLYFKIRVGPEKSAPPRRAKSHGLWKAVLPSHEVREIENSLPGIQDEELRGIVRRVFLKERSRHYKGFLEEPRA